MSLNPRRGKAWEPRKIKEHSREKEERCLQNRPTPRFILLGKGEAQISHPHARVLRRKEKHKFCDPNEKKLCKTTGQHAQARGETPNQ
jgi:uncharacterized protein